LVLFRRSALGLALVLLVSGCSGVAGSGAIDAADAGLPAPPASSAAPSPSGTVSAADAWDEDLDALVAYVEDVHPNPWWRIPKADFLARVAKLRTTLPDLDPVGAQVAILELVATIDGHTAVYPTELGFHFYGVELYEFSDGIYVIGAPGHPEAVGARLVGIGKKNLRAVTSLMTPLVSHDNSQSLKWGLPMALIMVEGLQAKGVVKDADQPGFRLVTTSGKKLRLDPEPLGWEDYQDRVGWYPVGLPPRDQPMSQAHRTDQIWSKALRGGVFYVQYNQVRRGLEDTVTAIKKAMARPGFRRLIIDVRNNGGGDNTTYGPLLATLRDPRLKGRLSILTGRETFSAATNFATEVEADTDAVFVGEPTGGRPNLYGDVRNVVLPNSEIVAHVSSRYWEFSTPDDTRPAVPVDVRVSLSSADYFAGHDPALTAARNPVPRTGEGP
jgi:hypothetical protein